MQSTPLKMTRVFLSILLLLSMAGLAPSAQAQRNIDDSDRVTKHGSVPPLARAEFDRGSADASMSMGKMLLSLSVRASAQAELNQFLTDVQNSTSPNFHKFLTPQQFGLRFGPTDQDLADATGWLKSHGLKVEEISTGRMSIAFSGNVQQVEGAFQTNIRQFEVNGKMHHANATDPSIPRALSSFVSGVVSLHDFPKQHSSNARDLPNFTTASGQHFMAPADFATIYNVGPLYGTGINGTGQSIAIVGRTNINTADIAQFRTFFGLPANPPVIILNGADPGIVSANEETEADLDVEWSGAVAKNATIDFVISASTPATDGVDLSASFIVNNNTASIMSTSFGLCEALLGPAGNTFWGNLYTQAAAQGITAFVSTGDNGAEGCNPPAPGLGPAVNGLASTPNNVAVGGTQFNEGAGIFWSAATNPVDKSSALSYIPEVVWNEAGIGATGGGASIVYPKPAFQSGPGVPADGVRDIPDVSLSSAGHDGYLIFQEGVLKAVGGTSAASPSFAGLMALVNQKNGPQGSALSVLYSMGQNQAAGGTAVYHDITAGTNTGPGAAGFPATAGFDQSTGWGSVDAANFVNFWNSNSPVADFTIAAAPPSQTLVQGGSTTYTVTIAAVNGFTGVVTLSATGLPAGATATFAPATITTAGSSTVTISTTAATPAGAYALTLTGVSGASTHSAAVTLIVNGAADFSISAAPASQSVTQGSSISYTATVGALNGFTGTVALGVSGLPTGATATFTPASVINSGQSTLQISTLATTPTGSFPLTITATSGAVSHTTLITLVVNAAVAQDFTISAFPPSQSASAGSNTGYGITIASVGGFAGNVSFTFAGLPAGATGSISPASVVGSGTVTFTVLTATTTPLGTYTLTVTGTSGALSHSATVSLTVTTAVPPPPPPPPPPPTATVTVTGNAQVPVPNVNQAGNIVWTITDTTTTPAANVIFTTNVPVSAAAKSLQLNSITVTENNGGAFVCTFTPTGGAPVPCAAAPVNTAGGTIVVTTPSLGGSTKNGNKPQQTMIVTVNVTNPAGTAKGTVFNATGTMTFGPGGVDNVSNTASVKITSN